MAEVESPVGETNCDGEAPNTMWSESSLSAEESASTKLRARADKAGMNLKLDLDLNSSRPQRFNSEVGAAVDPMAAALSPPSLEPQTPPPPPSPVEIPAEVSSVSDLLERLDKIQSGLSAEAFQTKMHSAHQLAQLLADSRSTPEMLPHIRQFLSTQLEVRQITRLLTHSMTEDALVDQLVLSVVTNLSFIGMTEQLVADPAVPLLVLRSVAMCEASPAMAPFALRAVYNLSSEPALLRGLLHNEKAVHALKAFERSRNVESANFARHTLVNLKRFAAAERSGTKAKLLARPSSAPPASMSKRVPFFGMKIALKRSKSVPKLEGTPYGDLIRQTATPVDVTEEVPAEAVSSPRGRSIFSKFPRRPASANSLAKQRMRTAGG